MRKLIFDAYPGQINPYILFGAPCTTQQLCNRLSLTRFVDFTTQSNFKLILLHNQIIQSKILFECPVFVFIFKALNSSASDVYCVVEKA